MTKQLNPEGLEAAKTAEVFPRGARVVDRIMGGPEHAELVLSLAIAAYLSVTPAVDLPGVEVEPVGLVSIEGIKRINEGFGASIVGATLRDEHFNVPLYPASAIEKLRTELDRTTFELEQLTAWFDGLSPAEMHDRIVRWKTDCETAEASVATLTARAERAEADVLRLRDKNRALARRAQLSEAVSQMVTARLQAWVDYFKFPHPPRKDRYLFMWEILALKKRAKILTDRATLTKENDNGR